MENLVRFAVAPLAGAWIEIDTQYAEPQKNHVAPLAGAWIEIRNPKRHDPPVEMSLPSRERGLKFAI